MTLFFPDLNVWLALSVASHQHSQDAWNWVRTLPRDSKLIYARYTQIGLLRLLTNSAAMGSQTLTLRKAWAVYDRWLEDPRVEFYPEARDAEEVFRQVTEPLAAQQASKAVGDCWLLACAMGIRATLATFDRTLFELCRKRNHAAVIPG